MWKMILASLAFFGLVVLAPLGFWLAHIVNEWEQANGYPFGKLCEVFASCM